MNTSTKFSLSTYDWYATVRNIALFVLSALIANLDIIQTQLKDWNVAPIWVALIVYALVDLGRRFIRDYSITV